MNDPVAIVTLMGNFNYGNRLQNYATQTLLARRGLDPVTLKFSDEPWDRRIKNQINKLLGRNLDPELKMSCERARRFEAFSRRIEAKTVSQFDPGLDDSFRAFFVGSDQVWNPSYANRHRVMFLSFSSPRKRIALSASFGVSSIPDKLKKRYGQDLSGFAHLSVRENDGAKIVRDLTGREASVIVDPTLMLSAEDWRAVSNDAMVPDYPYVLTYILGGLDGEKRRLLKEVSTARHARVLCLSDRDGEDQLPAGPSEFLALIAGAEHVVTDSFHASLFSVLFETPLTIVARNEKQSSFSRLETLVSKLGVKEKVFEAGAFSFESSEGYSRARIAIEVEKKIFDAYLSESLISLG